MPKIVDIYISRIVNTKEKKYGFAVTSDGLNAYIPARVVEDFDLTEDDLGTCNRVIIMESDDDRNGWHVATFVVEDSAMQQRNATLQEELIRLEVILRENDIEF